MTDNDKTDDSENNPPQQAQKGPSTAVMDDGKKGAKSKGGDDSDAKPEKKGFWTWDRFIDLLKVLATVYAACIGTIVTMQFNERQHELAKIEAIAKLLPSLASSEVQYTQPAADGKGTAAQSSPGVKEVRSNRVVRDGTMWAIFRTAQNKTMLRDLAALMPEDVYRVVGSIAAADALDQDNDSLTALEVASEKLAAKYSAEGDSALAGRLYEQALRLKKHEDGDSKEPLDIVDLTNLEHFDLSKYKGGDQQVVDMMQSAINLADAHVVEAKEDQKGGGAVNTTHSDAKTFYMHAIEAGEAHKSSPAVQLELAKAYTGISRIELLENGLPNAVNFTRKALECYETALGPHAREVGDTCIALADLLLKENPRSTEAEQLMARSKDILSKSPK